MKLYVCAVYDKKIGCYDQPFTVRHLGEAIRQWDIIVKKPDTKFGMNPEDFDLFQIGIYDETTAAIENVTPPNHIASGIQHG